MSDKSNYVLITDSTCDLPENILKDSGTVCAELTYRTDGASSEESTTFSFKKFHGRMREGVHQVPHR